MTKPRAAHLDIIYRWLKYKDHVSMVTVLHNMGINSVAIYGGGVLGELLYDYLYSTDISVKCIIDLNPDLKFPYDVDVVQPSQFLGSGFDAVIVTSLDYYNIKNSLQVCCPIISLNHLLMDTNELQGLLNLVMHIEKAGARLVWMDITNSVAQIKNPSPTELSILAHNANYTNYINSNNQVDSKYMSLLLRYYDDLPYCSEEYVNEVFPAFVNIAEIEDHLQDINSKHINMVNGLRYTFGNPQTYSNTIHFFGSCWAMGVYAEDGLTIESQLQSAINMVPLHNKIYRVVNNVRSIDSIPSSVEFCEGDIVIVITYNTEWMRYYLGSETFYDTKGFFDRPHNMGEIFFDNYYHMNHRGYKLVADKIYSILSKLPEKYDVKAKASYETIIFNNLTPTRHIAKHTDPELDNYISFLKSEKVDCLGTIGAIVMNCNPFTLGHRYLIEEARKQCDFLYVFVVEEDKSFFPFADRFMLVKVNTSDMENVKVLPSGNFIISTATFPEYFAKESSKTVKIDASKDIKIFAENIAPSLHITKRFVGEEPFDSITNQYNQAMIEELPRRGIAVTEAPRMQSNGVPISASMVRKLLENCNFDEISRLVPCHTLEYLTSKYMV